MTVAGDLVARLRAGDRVALARAITAVENETAEAAGVLRAIQPYLGHARVHGFTGPPGVGKSTLVDAYITELRARGMSVGVIAVDPSSPVSGGAILGDRVRMTSHGLDPEVFVRSIAARGHLGGLSATTAFVVDVMDAAGKDAIVIETVGAGQSEVEVAQVADTRVVICAPGAGDDVQAIKAGILEIGDLLVVNKADLPAAEVTVKQLQAMLALRRRPNVPGGWTPEVLATTATNGVGVAALADAILRHDEYLGETGRKAGSGPRLRALLAETAGRLAAERVGKLGQADLAPLIAKVRDGELDITSAAECLLREVAKDD
ncbi:MAG: methylmalonyl Co-A mutase-associated GTPase MeaB [Alphaproteobacteria bacterium]